jgi:hypothetical protein
MDNAVILETLLVLMLVKKSTIPFFGDNHRKYTASACMKYDLFVWPCIGWKSESSSKSDVT